MADNEKEIIRKIEAEVGKLIVPEVLSSKRSAFFNKGRNESSTLFFILIFLFN